MKNLLLLILLIPYLAICETTQSTGSQSGSIPSGAVDIPTGDGEWLRLDGTNGPMLGGVDFGNQDITNLKSLEIDDPAGASDFPWVVGQQSRAYSLDFVSNLSAPAEVNIRPGTSDGTQGTALNITSREAGVDYDSGAATSFQSLRLEYNVGAQEFQITSYGLFADEPLPLRIGINAADDSNAVAAPNVYIEASDKTAGTGNGGNVILSPGTSVGGTKGVIDSTNSAITNAASVFFNPGAFPFAMLPVAASGFQFTNLSAGQVTQWLFDGSPGSNLPNTIDIRATDGTTAYLRTSWFPGTTVIESSAPTDANVLPLLIRLVDDGTADASAGRALTIQGQNRTAGTGVGGSVVVKSGSSVGGLAGNVDLFPGVGTGGVNGHVRITPTVTTTATSLWYRSTGNFNIATGSGSPSIKWQFGNSGVFVGIDSSDGGFDVIHQASNSAPVAGRLKLYPITGDRWVQRSSADVIKTLATTDEVMLLSGAQNMTGAMNLGGFKIGSVADPTLAQDASTKIYTDNAKNTLTSGQVPATQTGISYSVDSDDHFVRVDTGSNVIDVTLPSPATRRRVVIKDVGGNLSVNALTVKRNAAESIEGVAADKVFSSDFGSWTFQSDGTNWWLI